MPFTKFANLDFDQIRTSIKDYLRANSDFTDFDFEGSNFSILIDTLAYNSYITAFNSNMIVNESFLDSATLRENVVALARNIGYVPRSRTAAKGQVSFDINLGSVDPQTSTVTLMRGLVCTGNSSNTSYTYSVPNNISTSVIKNSDNDYIASFNNVDIHEGTFLSKTFNVDTSINQKFILDNSYVDTSTISVFISGPSETGLGLEYSLVDNILNVNSTSEIYLLQEIQDEKYELFFGDGLIGKKLENGTKITVFYIVTDGKDGNGASSFSFAGSIQKGSNITLLDETVSSTDAVTVVTNQPSQNGADIEPISSIKYYAPRIYSSQYRAVTSRDYEAIIKKIYPETDSVAVVGGEEMDPPEFGKVSISIKPKNGTYVSEFAKSRILSQLKQYSISGIDQKIEDLKILYVEIDSSVYYNYAQISTIESLKTKVVKSLTEYSDSVDLNKFGGRFKYSKIQQVIDNTDNAITSNITRVRVRRDLKAAINQYAQYELCFGNQFHVTTKGYNIKSTGFTISGEQDTVYLTDTPNEDTKTGIISIVKPLSDGTTRVVVSSAGTVDYVKGEVELGTVNITSTTAPNNIIEIQAYPESNDVIGLQNLYLHFSISKSAINMVRDVISSGDEISGIVFSRDYYTSSYSNGDLIRK